jgi:tetratricopeptide (TPR) repeat protein/transcriptional regulator with XRE-family HTH domain
MTEPPAVSFASLLRQLRTNAGLTQEGLAIAAQLSSRSVSDLERGINLTARRDTTRLLADALNLTGPARAEFEAAARGRLRANGVPESALPTGGIAAATRTLPRDVASFTGRESELGQVAIAARDAAGSGGTVGICAIGGMAGVGKTAFAVHAAHRHAAQFPDGQIFLPLHGHTPGHLPVDPSDALVSLLLTAGVATTQIPIGLEERARLWRSHLAGKRLLLLLDDAAGHEQVRPLLPGTAGSLVLVTSRRHLTALEDTRTISLDTLPPAEAAELLLRLAGRTGQDPSDPAVGEITASCGYLPLAIGMLARQLNHHPTWTAAALAADLAAVRNRLELMRAEDLSVAAAFDLSYRDLTEDQQRLFRRLGLQPGTDVDAYAAAALDGTSPDLARRQLDTLYDQYLLTEHVRGRYRLHDLIREHARVLASADPAADTDRARARLLDYYLHTARAASQHLPRRPPASPPSVTGSPPAHSPDLPTHQAAVSWMQAERLNLHAAVGHAAASDQPRYVIAIAATMHGFLRVQGHWDQALTLHRAAIAAAHAVGDQIAQAGALADLGDAQYLTVDYSAADASLGAALALYRACGDRLGEASALSTLGVVQQSIGEYPAAAASQGQSLDLYRELGNIHGEAVSLNRLGRLRFAAGDYHAAAADEELALVLYRDIGDRLGEAGVLANLGGVRQATGDYPAAAVSIARALELHREVGYRLGEANALEDLGSVQHAMGDYPAAAASLTAALAQYRDLGSRIGEARALNRLGAVHQRTGDYPAAEASLSRALALHEELRSPLGQAQVLNTIGELSLVSATPAAAQARFERALAIAASIGSLTEEGRALEGIGRCRLQDGQADDGVASLRGALAIYVRIGSPGASRIQQALTNLGV